ncbi:MAG: uL13 family ribosomal protein [Candidatus Paceibacterota bacterium]|jgi:large subunit ribosomal protein L13
MKYTIDAQGKKLGRIASQAASILMGKNVPTFEKNKVSGGIVEITNSGRLDITALKKTRDIHVTYTGHRGGLNSESLGHMIGRVGMPTVLRQAVSRMLPNNKLRPLRMKNLIITE